MKSYSEKEVFDEAAVRAWQRATLFVHRVHEEFSGCRCHELARAVGRLLGFCVEDGHFGAVEHSWLVVPPSYILDVYVPGALPMVQLIDTNSALPFVGAYRPGNWRTDIDEETIEILMREMRA